MSITLTVVAANFADLNAMLAEAASGAVPAARRDTVAVLAEHNAKIAEKAAQPSVDDMVAKTNAKAETDRKIAADKLAKAKDDLATAPEGAKAVEQPANDGPPIVYADLQLKVMDVVQTKGREAMVAVLAKLGVETIKGIDEARYPEVKSALDEALAA